MLDDRDKALLSAVLDHALKHRPSVPLAVDTGNMVSLTEVVQRQNELLEKITESSAELKRGMALLEELLSDLLRQTTRPREPVALTILHSDGKTSRVSSGISGGAG